MGSFFDTAHDERSGTRAGGGGPVGLRRRRDDLAMDFLGASSARRGGRATTRDDLNLPDQAMEDLLGRIAGDRLPEGGGLDPFDARDSQALPEGAGRAGSRRCRWTRATKMRTRRTARTTRTPRPARARARAPPPARST